MGKDTEEVYAALDLGSNSFHLMLARFKGSRLIVLDRVKEVVRLGAGLGDDDALDDATMARGLAALRKMAERIRPLDKRYVRVVGTNTLRAAINADRFLERAERVLGVPINVISGIEEARLIYLGVARDFAPDQRTRLVVDIGGGSTELVLGRDRPLKLESCRMGCVSFAQRFFTDGVITPRRYEKALLAVRGELQGVVSSFSSDQFSEAVGASGSVRAIERVLSGLGLNRNHVITAEGVELLAQRVAATGHCDLLDLPGLEPERRAIFPGGLAVLHGVFTELELASMHVSDYAIREGIIYDLAGRLHRRDRRVETIEQMMEQYHVDRAQVRRVQRLALALLEQVEDQLDGEPGQARKLLRWTINLHEIGLSVAHSGYHKHGAYLLANSDMPGFSRQEQRLLSALVRNHRRKPRLESEGYGVAIDWRLVTVLRLACLFLRARDAALVPRGIKIRFAGRRCRLTLPAGWLERRPLALEDLLQEREQLAEVGIELVLPR